jgi:16S rRNA (uracil1498-N3)-methyltransferase
MRRFYAPPENFRDKNVSLSPEETRHLRDVLRLRESEIVSVFDGTGREFSCRIAQVKKDETILEIIEKASPSPISNLDLTLAVALLKGEKFDLVIQKSVELGVSKFIPITTNRTDVRLKESGKRHARWQKIALEAAKQSGRADLMKIEMPLSFEQFLPVAGGTTILFAERGGEAFSKIKNDKKITAVIGPEGGWDSSEIESAKTFKFQIVTLGGRIQRAETAAISIAAILQHRFGDLN